MTQEETIKILNDEEIASLVGKFHGGKEALDLAISALRPVSREQVEKVWRGEWQYHPEDYDEPTWTCSRCGVVWTLIDGTPDDNNMDFCPACGSPMTDEAVEMVMERMEVLKDAGD